jgi:hypothetical protein
MPLLVDTSVLIDVLRGRSLAERFRHVVRQRERLYVCAVIVDELVRGVRPGEVGVLDRLLDGLRIAPLGRTEGERAGAWRREFGDRGVTLSQADCLIAAAAIGAGARLATANVADFPMPELIVEPWVPS